MHGDVAVTGGRENRGSEQPVLADEHRGAGNDGRRRHRFDHALAPNALLIDEFIAREADAGRISRAAFRARPQAIRLHGHCHQKAFGAMGRLTRDLVVQDAVSRAADAVEYLIREGAAAAMNRFSALRRAMRSRASENLTTSLLARPTRWPKGMTSPVTRGRPYRAGAREDGSPGSTAR